MRSFKADTTHMYCLKTIVVLCDPHVPDHLTHPMHVGWCMYRTTHQETLPNGEAVPTIQVQLVADEVSHNKSNQGR